ncbi:hypothetical protein ACQP25_08245 [Microtetraspora malaysiensis]|uniref:hypothetical protein n=1 Tax=Microtetraspora malaysiensis TaxID=161358 RepID=UPI003D8BA5C9
MSDVAYRWRVRHKPTYDQGNGWSPMTFAVELAEKPGNVLLVTLPYARPDNWLLEQSMSVRPALVAQCIRRAISEGWASHRTGSAHRLELTRDELSPPHP